MNNDEVIKLVISKIDKFDFKLDKLDERLDNVDITLAKQEVSLGEHIKRSLANEKAVEILKEEVKPIITHVVIMNFIGKLSLVVLSSGVLWEILKLSFFK